MITIRDPYRLYKFYERLRDIHMEKFPDLRFGQLCYNFFGWLATEKGVDYFFPEEDEILNALERYADLNKSGIGRRAKHK